MKAVGLILVLCQINLILSQDPDISRTTCEIVIARGFACEIHYITTNEGYIVQAHRIPNENKKPVILQTGLIGTSADFIFASETVSEDPAVIGQNMGIELFKQGYDVWMTNNRGNIYGLNHTTLDPDQKPFWRFSFDQLSKYDVPAYIDYVLSTTGQSKLHFVGHSQGSAVMFALLSQTSDYNDKIESFTAISPITRIGFATTSFRALIIGLKPTLWLGGEVFAKNVLTSTLVPLACGVDIINAFCQGVFFSVTGPDASQLNSARLPVYLAHMPSSTSAKNLLHFDQLFNSNKFQKYDYGWFENFQKYGSLSAPEYPLTSISHPNVHVIYGRNDLFVPLSGVTALRSDLAGINANFYEISNPLANHMDPLIGIDVAVEVNKKVIQILNSNACGGGGGLKVC